MKSSNQQPLELQKIRNQLFLEYVNEIADFEGYYSNSAEKFNKGRFNNLKSDDQKFVLEAINDLSKDRQEIAQEVIANYLFYLNYYGIYDKQDISRLRLLLKEIVQIPNNNKIDSLIQNFEDHIKNSNIEYVDQQPSKTALILASFAVLSGLPKINLGQVTEPSSAKINNFNNNLELPANNNSSAYAFPAYGNIYDALYQLLPTLPNLLPTAEAKSAAKATVAEIEKNNRKLIEMINGGKSTLIQLKDFIDNNSVDLKSKDFDRYLNLLFINKHFELLQIFIENGANLDAQNKDGNSLLMVAIAEGNSKIYNALIKNGVDLNIKNSYGNTALILAADKGDYKATKLLIEKNVNLNIKNENGETALLRSIHGNHIELSKLLIEKGADLNIKNKEGYTFLMITAGVGNYKIAKLLIEKGVNINEKNKYGETALLVSTSNDQIEVAELLIENSADLNIKNNDGYTALIGSAEIGNYKIFKLLIDKGASLNERNKHGDTALLESLHKNHIEIAKTLIESGADLNLKNNDGYTALEIAKLKKQDDIVKLIEKKLNEVELKNKNKAVSKINQITEDEVIKKLIYWTENASDSREVEEFIKINKVDLSKNKFDQFLIKALQNNNPGLSRTLLQNRANPNSISLDFPNYSGLLIAIKKAARFSELGNSEASEHYVAAAELLIENGDDLNIEDKNGITALMVAIGDGNTKIANLLIDKGANLNTRETSGYSALFIALQAQNNDLIIKLIESGANPYIADNNGQSLSDFIQGNLLSIVAENNRSFLKLVDSNPNQKQISAFVKRFPINFYLKDREGNDLMYHLRQKYQYNQDKITNVLKAAIPHESRIKELLEYKQNESKRVGDEGGYGFFKALIISIIGIGAATYLIRSNKEEKKKKLEELKLTLEYFPILQEYLNENNIDTLLKISVSQNVVNFSSKDPILQKSFEEIFNDRRNNSKNKHRKSIELAQQIEPSELIKKYITEYSFQNYKLIKEDDKNFANKIYKAYKNQESEDKDYLLKLILTNPKELDGIIKGLLNLASIDSSLIIENSKKEEGIVNHQTRGTGNCLIDALTGTYSPDSGFIENSNHLSVRGELIDYIRSNLNELSSYSPASIKTPIALSILDHFLITAKTNNSSDEVEYYKNNLAIFQQYENQELIRNTIISDVIESDEVVTAIYNDIILSADLQNRICEVSGWSLERLLDSANNEADQKAVIKYILRNPSLRTLLGNDLNNLKNDLNNIDAELIKETRNVINGILNYYSKDGIWLTGDFAEIYAKINNLNIVIHTGRFSSNGEEQISKFSYGPENLAPVHIGIRNGEKGNHFEKIDNLELWLEEEKNKHKNRNTKFENNYQLLEATVEKISNRFLKYHDSLSVKERQDFYNNYIGEENDATMLGSILQSIYEDKNNLLPHYLWEGIASEIYYELINRNNSEFFIKKINSSSKISTDFQAIANSGIEFDYTVSSIPLINNFAFDVSRINSKQELGEIFKKNGINSEILSVNSATDFLSYVGNIVAASFRREFKETPAKIFWGSYQKLDIYKNEKDKNKANKKYHEDLRKWMEGDFEIVDESGNKIIYNNLIPDFDKWKEEAVDALIFESSYNILNSIDNKKIEENLSKITLAQKKEISNLRLEKLSEKEFTVLLSYVMLEKKDTKQFLWDKIKVNMPEEEDQKAFLFKAELMSDFIEKDKILPLDIVSYFKVRQQNKEEKKSHLEKDPTISYQINNGQKEVINKKDIIIPLRRNPNQLKIVFTEEVKEQIEKNNEKLEDWKEIADKGFVGSIGQSGIKNLKTDNNLWELKTKEAAGLKAKRCYAIQKGNMLFVVGYGDKQSQDRDITKYKEYEVQLNVNPNEKVSKAEIYNLKNINQKNQVIH